MASKRETYLQKHFIYFFAGALCILSFVFLFYASHVSSGQLRDNILIQAVTAIIGLLQVAAGYFLGSSHLSKKKEDMMDGMIPASEESMIISAPPESKTTVTSETKENKK